MKMKKFGFCILIFALVAALTVGALAEDLSTDQTWQVTFTEDTEMQSDFRTADLDESVSGLQPGDEITFTLRLTNENTATTNWYMTNEVLQSLEDSSANSATAGGAYTYVLTYTDPDGAATTLFSSDTIGGDDQAVGEEGLNAATDTLEDWFYLDTLTSDQSGLITLTVALDGETQGNDYQDTLAQLQMNFAVELDQDDSNPTPTPTSNNPNSSSNSTPTPTMSATSVKTGDDTDLFPFILISLTSGCLLLELAIYSLKHDRRPKKEAHHD